MSAGDVLSEHGANKGGNQAAWAKMQEKTFTRWTNEQLKGKGRNIDGLRDGFHDGLNLLALIEVCTQNSPPRHNKRPKTDFQKMENCAIAMEWIKAEGITLVNIGSEDIFNGDVKLICGLIWTLIIKYKINGGKNGLLAWVNSKIGAGTPYNMPIKNFTKDWNDGKAVCALTDALAPGTVPNAADLDPNSGLQNARQGMGLADTELGVAKIIMPKEMVDPKVDELSMMAYISQFMNATPKAPSDASQSRAYGPGLVEGIKNEQTSFTVETPLPKKTGHDGSNCEVVVRIVAPDGSETTSTMNVLPKSRMDTCIKTECVYTPSGEGEYQIHVEVCGEPIAGSAFLVNILPEPTLGGEGKIRVYYSTTSSTERQRSDQNKLQDFLEIKSIHTRPDFEPWIPVDIMEKRDRDLVFEKAGSKTLPIVFIDDEYVGDYEKCVELNENGELDKLLRMDKYKK